MKRDAEQVFTWEEIQVVNKLIENILYKKSGQCKIKQWYINLHPLVKKLCDS